MFKYLLLLVVSLLMLNLVQGATAPFTLNEANLLELAAKGSPRLEEIEAAMLNARVMNLEVKEGFAPELFGSGSYAETNEQALINFQPIFSPTSRAQLGVRQNLKFGASAQAAVTADQRSSPSTPFAGKFRDATTVAASFTMQLDLWKNLLGRLDEARLDYAALDAKNAELQKDIQSKSFRLSLRKLFWALVANHEAIKISEELLKTSKRQAEEARLRLKNAVADVDEVARYDAQVTSRTSAILFLRYQRELYLAQLRNLLPEQLGTAEIVLGEYSIQKAIDEVLACTATISRQGSVPYEFTKYDEITSMLRKMRSNRATINDRYSDPDVKLFGTVKSTGVASDSDGANTFRGSYGEAVDDNFDTNRTGYEVGLAFSIPLGSAKESTQKSRELYDEKRLLANIHKTDAMVTNTHYQVLKSIGLLHEVVRNQRLTAQSLTTRLKGMKRKYQQARVSVNDLIMDQDALLNSELNVLDAQTQALNLIFDYLVVFTETPCAFNRN